MDMMRKEQVGCFGDAVREASLKCLGHVKRRDRGYVGRRSTERGEMEDKLFSKNKRGRRLLLVSIQNKFEKV